MGVVSMPAMLAPILGPVVGGVILQNLHWSWIFLVNVPDRRRRVRRRLADAARRPTRARRARSTWLGLVLLLDGVDADRLRPQRSSARNADLGAADVSSCRSSPGSSLSGVFCVHALRVERPLLDVRLYAQPGLRRGVADDLRARRGAVRGDDPRAALLPGGAPRERDRRPACSTGPQGLGMLLVMPIAGRLTERFGGGRDRARRRLDPRASARSRSRSSTRNTSIARDLRRCSCAGRGHRLLVHARDDGRLRRRCAPSSSPTRRRS